MDFDLRAHIEAGGHAVAACSHLSVTRHTCRGSLTKMGGRVRSWRRRWFLFDRLRRTLCYYAGTFSYFFVYYSSWWSEIIDGFG